MMIIEIVFISFASLSAACSASIVSTGLVFPSIMLSPLHPFSNILFMIALVDLIACIGWSFGYPNEGSRLCTTQAFLALFFIPASWLWSSALVYQMHCMIVHKKLFLSMTHLHVICWSIPSVIALLPLSRNPYGQDDDLNGSSICLLHCVEHDCYLWNLGLYVSTLLINIFLMSYYLYKMHGYLRNQKSAMVVRETALFQSLSWYPIGLIVCWTFTIMVEVLIAATFGHRTILIEIAAIISSQYGTICCIIFFSSSSLVRKRWWVLLTCTYGQTAISRADSNSTVENYSRESFLSDLKGIEIIPSVNPSVMGLDFDDGNIECKTVHHSFGEEQLRDRNISTEPLALFRIHEDTVNVMISSSKAVSKCSSIDH